VAGKPPQDTTGTNHYKQANANQQSNANYDENVFIFQVDLNGVFGNLTCGVLHPSAGDGKLGCCKLQTTQEVTYASAHHCRRNN
jgi:hypothetical protein